MLFLLETVRYVTYNFGSWPDWFSALGSVGGLWFIYGQLKEQQKEFYEDNKIDLQIAFNQQLHAEKTNDGGTLLGGMDYYIWSVNNGSRTSSFKFLGFCRGDDISKIDEEDVIVDPKNFGFKRLLPHQTNDFELLDPGQVSHEYIVKSEDLFSALGTTDSFFVIYMNATGQIFKREVRVTHSSNEESN